MAKALAANSRRRTSTSAQAQVLRVASIRARRGSLALGMTKSAETSTRTSPELAHPTLASPHACPAQTFLSRVSWHGDALVVGEGPLAASCVEHFLRQSTTGQVTWVGRAPQMATLSFPPSRRYDHLIADAARVRRWDKPWNFSTALLNAFKPQDDRVRIFLGMIDAVTKKATGLWQARCGQGHDALAVLTRSAVQRPATEICDFSLLVVSASSETGPSELGSAAFLTRSLPKSRFRLGLMPLEEHSMIVGLSTEDGALRVLGSASRNRELADFNAWDGSDPARAYRQWHDSLCAQARMPNHAMGIAVGAATIAMANGYYKAAPDRCSNTLLTPEPTWERHVACEPYHSGGGPSGYDEYPRHA